MYLDDLSKLEDFQVTLKGPKGFGDLTGLLDLSTEETFSLQTGAQFSGSVFTSGLADAAKSALGTLLDRGSKSGMGTAAVSKFQTVGSSIQIYDGPADISIQVNMHMIEGIHQPGTYKEMELLLAKLTQPNFKSTTDLFKPYFYDDNTISIMTDLFNSNLGYEKLDAKMFRLTIGSWLEAHPLKVNSINRTYSNYKNHKGRPLFCKLALDVSPYRALNAEELAAWFKG